MWFVHATWLFCSVYVLYVPRDKSVKHPLAQTRGNMLTPTLCAAVSHCCCCCCCCTTLKHLPGDHRNNSHYPTRHFVVCWLAKHEDRQDIMTIKMAPKNIPSKRPKEIRLKKNHLFKRGWVETETRGINRDNLDFGHIRLYFIGIEMDLADGRQKKIGMDQVQVQTYHSSRCRLE